MVDERIRVALIEAIRPQLDAYRSARFRWAIARGHAVIDHDTGELLPAPEFAEAAYRPGMPNYEALEQGFLKWLGNRPLDAAMLAEWVVYHARSAKLTLVRRDEPIVEPAFDDDWLPGDEIAPESPITERSLRLRQMIREEMAAKGYVLREVAR